MVKASSEGNAVARRKRVICAHKPRKRASTAVQPGVAAVIYFSPYSVYVQVSRRSFEVGRFENPSLRELRVRSAAAGEAAAADASGALLKLSVVNGDVSRILADRENGCHATFQVPYASSPNME